MTTRPTAITGIINGRDWRLDLAQRGKVTALSQESADTGLVGRVDVFSSGESAASLTMAGEFQAQHPWLSSAASLFQKGPSQTRKEGEDRLFRARTLELLGETKAWPASEHIVLSGQGPLHAEASEKPSALSLQENLAKSMRDYPSAHQVVLISGHFQPGKDELAELSTSHIAQALAQAAGQAPIHAFVTDGCYFGGVDQLKKLPENVQYAIVSQRATTLKEQLVLERGVEKARIFLGLNLTDSLEPTDSAATLAQQIVERGTGHSGVALAAIDMKAFRERLLPALSQLSQALTKSDKKLLATQARIADEVKQVDLGHFLDSLDQQASPRSREILPAVRKALEASILVRSVDEAHPNDSGLNVGWATFD